MFGQGGGVINQWGVGGVGQPRSKGAHFISVKVTCAKLQVHLCKFCYCDSLIFLFYSFFQNSTQQLLNILELGYNAGPVRLPDV